MEKTVCEHGKEISDVSISSDGELDVLSCSCCGCFLGLRLHSVETANIFCGECMPTPALEIGVSDNQATTERIG